SGGGAAHPRPAGRRWPWVTLSVALVLAGLFGAAWWQDGAPLWQGGGRLRPETLLAWGSCDSVAVRVEGQWWRLFTGAFVHGAWWHLGLNLWAWWVLGSWLELRVGARALCVVASAAAVSSTAAAMCLSEAPAVVGWSGAVFGVAG